MNAAVCCYCPRNTELSLGYWSSRHPHIKFCLPLFVSYMHVHARFIMYCSTSFSKKGIVYIFLNMTMFIGSQSFISLPSFMFVSAAVSELRESNQNKKEKNSEIGYFQFNTFPGYIIHPFFNQRYLLSICVHSMC